MKALVIKSTGLWYEILLDGEVHKARLRGRIRLEGIKTTNPVAVGDWVICEKDKNGEFTIKSIERRKNYVIRRSTKLSAQAHILASNIDQAVVVVSLKSPRTSLGFVDRFLVTTESFRIPTIIVFNKEDIYTKQELIEIAEIRELYQSIGYETILTSVKTKNGISNLKKELESKITMFSGHSGVGKSSLLNEIDQGLNLPTQNISSHTDKGQHTTTFATMYFLDDRTKIIDTPGIKEIGLYNIEKEELCHYFKEFKPFLGTCKFNNCTHNHEPGCVIKHQAEINNISKKRYDSYLHILNSEDVK